MKNKVAVRRLIKKFYFDTRKYQEIAELTDNDVVDVKQVAVEMRKDHERNRLQKLVQRNY